MVGWKLEHKIYTQERAKKNWGMKKIITTAMGEMGDHCRLTVNKSELAHSVPLQPHLLVGCALLFGEAAVELLQRVACLGVLAPVVEEALRGRQGWPERLHPYASPKHGEPSKGEPLNH